MIWCDHMSLGPVTSSCNYFWFLLSKPVLKVACRSCIWSRKGTHESWRVNDIYQGCQNLINFLENIKFKDYFLGCIDEILDKSIHASPEKIQKSWGIFKCYTISFRQGVARSTLGGPNRGHIPNCWSDYQPNWSSSGHSCVYCAYHGCGQCPKTSFRCHWESCTQ